MRIAVLDDYHQIAGSLAPWSIIDGAQVTFFDDSVTDHAALVDRLAPFDVVCLIRERTPMPAELVSALPNLKLLVTAGRANPSIDVAAAHQHGVAVCGTDSTPTAMPELAWAMVFAALRDIPRLDAAVREGRWQNGTRLGVGLSGSTIGFIGLGKSGGIMARQARAFDAHPIAWSENLTDQRANDVGAERATLEELLKRADIVVVTTRLSDRTRGLIGRDQLNKMKETAFLINPSRGPIVDEAALIEALAARSIAGAALDVFDTEPLRADHPLTRLDNVVLTPHMGYVTRGQYTTFFTQMVEAIVAYIHGEIRRPLQS